MPVEPEFSRREFVDGEGVTIQYYVWAAASPVAALQLVHGLGEYALRHEPLARALAASGITVYALDLRGHGQTGLGQYAGDHSKLGRPGPGGIRAVVADLHQFTTIIRSDVADLPLFYLGHSWGSLMGQLLINEHAGDFAGVVLTGTAYRWPGSMNAGDLNAKHKHLGATGFEWLSRDVAVAEAFLADPLTVYAGAAKLYGLVDGLRLFGRPRKPMPANVPLLMLIGSEDSLGGPESVHKLADAYRDRGGLTDVTVEIYEEARHEVFNETNKAEVISDLQAWLAKHLQPVQ
jgi:alpha-beta hydrolase superfamily lysophospholipase